MRGVVVGTMVDDGAELEGGLVVVARALAVCELSLLLSQVDSVPLF